MSSKVLAGLCILVAVVCQVWSTPHRKQEDPSIAVLRPWQQSTETGGLKRVKRAWVIPPINTPENNKQIPKQLVQIKSDKREPGKVIYKLEGPGVDQDPRGYFEINEKTGLVTLKTMLDRESYSKFKLKAYALDLSGERLEDPTELEIIVLDQNDNRPVFTQPEYIGTVLEFSTPGTSVMQVTATDADDHETDNAILSYSIIRQDSIPPFHVNKTMFGIDNSTGVIFTRDVGLDSEIMEGFNLTLQVADMSGMGLTAYSTAIIYIKDINDNAPIFTPKSYYFEAAENEANFLVGTINATDIDEENTPNWRIKFNIIAGDPDGHFDVRTDSATNQGMVFVVKPLDYETVREYQLTVTAENEAPLSSKAPQIPLSSATVTITVLNQNEAPGFRSNPIKLSVAEGTPQGTVLARDIASDPDRQQLRYDIEYDPGEWLSVNSETGEIRANKMIDKKSPFLEDNVYRAEIRVSDTGEDRSTATATVEITVMETNDYPPVIFPLSGSVCSDPEKGSGLILSAVDMDQSPHGPPFYFNLFINTVTVNWTLVTLNGTHVALRLLRELEAGPYPISVRVSDSGQPTLSALYTVNVSVCQCDEAGDCRALLGALFAGRTGLSLAAVLIILGSVALLLLSLLIVAAVGQCRRQPLKQGLLGGSDDDIRDNVLNYDEQGGGEEDENAYNIDQLRNPDEVVPPLASALPRPKQPLRKDAPYNYPSPSYPRKPPTDPTDIEDFINDTSNPFQGLDAADNDPNVPPYDTALIYDYEGEGSLAGSLSSIASGSSDGDQDYDYLNDWGPRFKKLANLYDQH
ncbi:cadherin-15 isoform X1 [Lepisosteus oculatus]|uniref:cadherin-15 isoform X1 n=1 Tax=Lepisosteus oculatus TaxID=7918 RepID=UPI0007404B60|nr:PREDICTED: cadherin-15 isoform X1 [Lepisosteus oculatus]